MASVTIRGLISTTRLRAGDEVTVEYTDSIGDLERSGFVEILDNMTGSAADAAAATTELTAGEGDDPENNISGEVASSESPEVEAPTETEKPKRAPRKRAPRKAKTDG